MSAQQPQPLPPLPPLPPIPPIPPIPPKRPSLGYLLSENGEYRVIPIHPATPTTHSTTSTTHPSPNLVFTAKYTIWSFPLKFLREQFRKYSNLFFLLTVCIQFIPGISPLDSSATIVPLLLVLTASAVKEILEDRRRHRNDREVNNRTCRRLSGDAFVEIKWRDVRVGDILRLEEGEFLPADMVLLSSSEPDALCYIETSSLDGETNLKLRQGLSETAHILTPALAHSVQATMHTELPNSSLYTFEGSLEFQNQRLPLTPQQILLRGAMVKNTRWIYGIVIFTGHETKLLRNATSAPLKQTEMERMTNRQILFLFLLLVILSVVSAAGNLAYSGGSDRSQYLGTVASYAETLRSFMANVLTFMILYNNLIPISLVVTMEIVRLFQAYLINSDLDMYHEKTDTPAVARTSTLVEELGQIDYVFSDKTGTLTCNEMSFQKCSIAGCMYGKQVLLSGSRRRKETQDIRVDVDGNRQFEFTQLVEQLSWRKHTSMDAQRQHAEYLHQFLTLLAVCHTVIPERIPDSSSDMTLETIRYQASSPDENALVLGARSLGYFLHTRKPRSVIIRVPRLDGNQNDGVEEQQDLEYEILCINEFNSTRKRMSAVVRAPDGSIQLLVKGADTVILERLQRCESSRLESSEEDQTVEEEYGSVNPFVEATLSHMELCATEGLRTLCIATRTMSEEEYCAWRALYDEAATSINQRKEKLDAVAEQIEKDLFLLGATAIEDKLQYGVPETIHLLLEAGIKVWMLTGDRQETAINIGFSCKLLRNSMNLLVVHEESAEKMVIHLQSQLGRVKKHFARHNVTLPPERFDPCNYPPPKWYTKLWCRCFHVWNAVVTRANTPMELQPMEPADFEFTPSTQFALVIDGASLSHALTPKAEQLFLELATLCKSVICCRVSPLQKALIVKLAKHYLSACTLAIGDGANDVSMIQAAHVGVGISGNEGMQAARSSDFAIAQFRYLQKLLLVHGSWIYYRMSKVILYGFYKNIALYMTQFWFAFYNGFSGQTVIESWLIAFYNTFFTALPPFALGFFDQFMPAALLLQYPSLYTLGRHGKFFNIQTFWGWTLNGIVHSFMLFYMTGWVLWDGVLGTPWRMTGMATDLWYAGVFLYAAVVFTVSGKIALEMNYWTRWSTLAVVGSVVFWLVFFLAYSEVGMLLRMSPELVGMNEPVYLAATYWLSMILLPIACLLRDFTWKYTQRQYRLQSYHVIREQEYLRHHSTATRARLDTSATSRSARLMKLTVDRVQRMMGRRGFSFSQGEGQADVVQKYDTSTGAVQERPSGL